jgi:hypothetical protein
MSPMGAEVYGGGAGTDPTARPTRETGATGGVYGGRMAGSHDQGFEVAATRVGGQAGADGAGPGRPRRGRLRFAVVIVAVLAIPAMAFAGPRIEWRPSIDLSVLRPTPTAIPSPTEVPIVTPTPSATPLPPVTIAAGPLPSEPLPIDSEGFRLVDPATGVLGPPGGFLLERDAVFREPGGDGWWCVCFERASDETTETVTVTVRHVDRSLGNGQSFPIATYASGGRPGVQDFNVRLAVDRSPDGRIAYLAVGTLGKGGWKIHVDRIDLERGRLLGGSDLTTINAPLPGASPSVDGSQIEPYLDGPTIRFAADGRQVMVLASLYPNTETGEPDRRGWLIDAGGEVANATAGTVLPIKPAVLEISRNCGWITWFRQDELITTCWGSGTPGQEMSVRTFDLDGRQTGAVEFTVADGGRLTEPLFDGANQLAYFWDASTHILRRLDLARGTEAEIDVAPWRAITPASATPTPGIEPLANLPPAWTRVSSDFPTYSERFLISEPGGTRLFAIGTTDGSALSSREMRSGSTGVWVFDTRTFANVDHWPAAAAYNSIALSPDGRWLTAVGQAGIDVTGNPAGWESSISVYDTSDGRLALQVGSLGLGQPLTLP